MSMTPPKITVLAVEAFERAYALRMPFRFGGVTNTHGRQAVIRLLVRMADGREGWGYASESLGGKWFDKNPALSDEQGLNQLRLSLRLAIDAYLASGPNTPFGFFADNYTGQVAACAARGLLPLVSTYGPALLDRGILDAICRLEGISFYTAMRGNLPGMQPHAIMPDMAGFDFTAFLAGLQPTPSMDARHTVGLVDPLVAADQKPEDRVNDGLPETLEEVIAAYGHRYFKLKIGGNRAADIERLSRIATVLDRLPAPYFATIDGNEQYENADAALDFWRAMEAEPALKRLRESTLFVEQPIMRQTALSTPVGAFTAVKPLIIDESDGEIDSFVRAKAMGYNGVSSKVCKGFYKSVTNRARCQLWNAEQTDKRYFMSAEDLTVHAGLSLQQDLVLVNLLGLGHVERNGHHYVDGFGDAPAAEAKGFAAAHPDLYESAAGRPRLAIRRGRIALGSLHAAPGFASAAEPDWTSLSPLNDLTGSNA